VRDPYAGMAFACSSSPASVRREADALSFVALAVHQLGAIAMFRSPSEGPVLYLAVFEPRVGAA
jgi:hypothetical protein